MLARRQTASPASHWGDTEDDTATTATNANNHNPRSSVAASSSASVGRAQALPDAAAPSENFNVFVRARPPLPRELHGYRSYVNVVQLSSEAPGTVTLCDAVETADDGGHNNSGGGGGAAVVYSRQHYTFDYVYGPGSSQQEVYERSARPAVLSVMEGYNATLMAYGQTGTGKTYTMEGFTNVEERGIIPRSVEEIFAYISAHRGGGDGHNHHHQQQQQHQTRFLVRASYMQVYNEVISDLLVPPSGGGSGGRSSPNTNSGFSSSTAAASHTHAHGGKTMSVRHTPQRGVYIDGLSEWIVRSPADVYGLIEQGTANRATSSTKMSELSSRSHAIFTIVVEMLQGDEAAPISYRCGKLNIVDLAGSEKVHQSGVTGQRLEETKNINRSLHELGNVISALATKSGAASSPVGSGRRGGGGGGGAAAAKHIPFRNSVLTSALRDSLGGNCNTTLIACISPALESYSESLSTLMFANRAKNIRTTAVVNEDMDQAMLLRRYEAELTRLRELLREQQQQPMMGSYYSSQQQQQPLGASGALCTFSQNNKQNASFGNNVSFVSELEEGRQHAVDDREAVLQALRRSSRTCQELEGRIQELETMLDEGGFSGVPLTSEEYTLRLEALDRDRVVMETDKAQVERYKQLLLQQRDIMLNLTTRLNERDEAILRLQEEIDAYDGHVAELEDQIVALLTDREEGEGEGQRGEHKPQGPTATVSVMSRAEAEHYLRQCRLPPSATAPSSPRYRSDRAPEAALTAEDKLMEVLQGRGGGVVPPPPPPLASALSSQLRLSNAEVARLRACAERGAESAAAVAAAARADALRCDLDAVSLRLAASDGATRLYRRALELASSGGGEQQQQQQQHGALTAEVAAATAVFEAQVQTATAALGREREERRRVARELERLRFELEQQQVGSDGTTTPAARKAAVSRLWQALRALEGEIAAPHAQGRGLPLPLAVSGGGEAAAMARAAKALQEAMGAREGSWRRTLEEQQCTIHRLTKAAAAAVPTDTTAAAAATTVAALQKELAVQRKDRRALKTILDQRIRTKVERICELTKGDGGGAGANDGGGDKLSVEAKSLLTLVNASIKAMDS